MTSFIVRRVDPLDAVEAQAVKFDIDELFKEEAPNLYFPNPVAGAEYQSCQQFQRNQCFKGDRCPFRHLNDRIVLCKHWLRGLCKKDQGCEFLHEYDLSRMPECQFYKDQGECNNPDCLWRHVTLEDKARADACPWYFRGFCRHGPKCRFKHAKLPMCVNWLAGFCPLGPSCPSGHPKGPPDEELATYVKQLDKKAMLLPLSAPTTRDTRTGSGGTQYDPTQTFSGGGGGAGGNPGYYMQHPSR